MGDNLLLENLQKGYYLVLQVSHSCNYLGVGPDCICLRSLVSLHILQ